MAHIEQARIVSNKAEQGGHTKGALDQLLPRRSKPNALATARPLNTFHLGAAMNSGWEAMVRDS